MGSFQPIYDELILPLLLEPYKNSVEGAVDKKTTDESRDDYEFRFASSSNNPTLTHWMYRKYGSSSRDTVHNPLTPEDEPDIVEAFKTLRVEEDVTRSTDRFPRESRKKINNSQS